MVGMFHLNFSGGQAEFGYVTIGPVECWGIEANPVDPEEARLNGDFYYYGMDFAGWDNYYYNYKWKISTETVFFFMNSV